MDRQLQEQTLAALERQHGVNAAHIGVSVRDGVVTLHGVVPTFREKWLAERTVRCLPAVRAFSSDLQVVRRDAPAGRHTADD